MKLFHIGLLLFSALLLHSCIGEDMDSCPDVIANNLSIDFIYTDKDDKDIFLDKISKVDLYVFDQSGLFVTSKCVEQASLSAFAGTHLNLSPGTYRIVLWGNLADKNYCGGVNTGSKLEDAFIANSTVTNDKIGTNGDRLYYAPSINNGGTISQDFTVTIPDQGTKNIAVTFGRAHIKVVAYVKGLDDKSAQGTQLPPIIELSDIPSSCNFELQPFGDAICYRDVSTHTTISGEELATIEFNTPLFENDTPMQLLIKKQSDGTTLTTVCLKDFIRDNGITIDKSSVDMTLSILVEYKQGSVEISIPGWGQTPVNPEL